MAIYPNISQNGIHVSRELLGLPVLPDHPCDLPQHLRDAVFIAIDFEHHHNIVQDASLDLNSQAGVAVLDIQDLQTAHPTQAISTFHFVTGSRDYRAEASKKFLFGTSTTVERKDMLRSINSLFPKSRYVVLVGHSVNYELDVLDTLQFDFRRVGTILDTHLMSEEACTIFHKLGDLLVELECPVGNLHCAGNDAHFTLQLLLLLALKDYAQPVKVSYIERLREIGRFPIHHCAFPHSITPQDKESRAERREIQAKLDKMYEKRREDKRKWRLRRKRGYNSEFWDPEVPMKVQQERRVSREEFLDNLEQIENAADWLEAMEQNSGENLHLSKLSEPDISVSSQVTEERLTNVIQQLAYADISN